MGTTPKYAIPYPEPGDTMASYPATSKTAAETIEAALGNTPWRSAAGVVSIGVPAANGGTSATVTFPVGRFTQAPIVAATAFSNGYGAASIGTPSTTAVPVKYYNPTASIPVTPMIYWIAVQMLSTAGPGLLAAAAAGAGGGVVVCHTAGCGNNGAVIPVGLATVDADGITQPVTHVVCGVCSQPILDIRR